ncbi:hypothetical protein GCM10027187_09150 [Streptosporangium sandarakinum]
MTTCRDDVLPNGMNFSRVSHPGRDIFTFLPPPPRGDPRPGPAPPGDRAGETVPSPRPPGGSQDTCVAGTPQVLHAPTVPVRCPRAIHAALLAPEPCDWR